MKIKIIIPARYGSTRFPGKPLAKIRGRTMLERVSMVAHKAAEGHPNTSVTVATDDKRILCHCNEINVECIMTGQSCATGTDRVAEAVSCMTDKPDYIINLQGDAPFTPPPVLEKIIKACKGSDPAPVITPVHNLTWDELDRFRENKKTTPFSGTTAVLDKNMRALWFSKQIMPAIRKEEELRHKTVFSPVWRHLGLYAYTSETLRNFVTLEEGYYEKLEGLEQLRFIENGIAIDCVPVDGEQAGFISTGIDSPEDLERANTFLDEQERQRA